MRKPDESPVLRNGIVDVDRLRVRESRRVVLILMVLLRGSSRGNPFPVGRRRVSRLQERFGGAANATLGSLRFSLRPGKGIGEREGGDRMTGSGREWDPITRTGPAPEGP